MAQKGKQPKMVVWLVAIVVVLNVLNTSIIANAEEEPVDCKAAVDTVVFFVKPFIGDFIKDPQGTGKTFSEALEGAKVPDPIEAKKLVEKYKKCVPDLSAPELKMCTQNLSEVISEIRDAQEKVKNTSSEDARQKIADDAAKSIEDKIEPLLKKCKLPFTPSNE